MCNKVTSQLICYRLAAEGRVGSAIERTAACANFAVVMVCGLQCVHVYWFGAVGSRSCTRITSANHITFFMTTLHSAWPHYIIHDHITFCMTTLQSAWPCYILQATIHSAGHITFCKSRYIQQVTLHSASTRYILLATLHSASHVTFCMATLHSAFCKASTLHPPQQHNSVCHNQPIARSTTCVRTCEESLDIDKISMTL